MFAIPGAAKPFQLMIYNVGHSLLENPCLQSTNPSHRTGNTNKTYVLNMSLISNNCFLIVTQNHEDLQVLGVVEMNPTGVHTDFLTLY